MDETNMVIINFRPVDTTLISGGKIAVWLSKLLGVKIVDRYLEPIPHDVTIVTGGCALYCTFRETLAEVVKHSKRVIWIVNDCTTEPPQVIQQLGKQIECWSTFKSCPHPGRKIWNFMNFTQCMNWNLVVWNPQPLIPYTESGLLYYGAYRVGREDLFNKYLAGPHTVHISCTPRNSKKFADVGTFMHWPTFKECAFELQKFQASIYIEDKISRVRYTSPANRFYECLSAGIPLWIDRSCMLNLQQYPIDPAWVVDSAKDIYWGDTADMAHAQPELRPQIEFELSDLATQVKAHI